MIKINETTKSTFHKIEQWEMKDLEKERWEFKNEDLERWISQSYSELKQWISFSQSYFAWKIHIIWKRILSNMALELSPHWSKFPKFLLFLIFKVNSKKTDLEKIQEAENFEENGKRQSWQQEEEEIESEESEDEDPNSKELLKVLLRHGTRIHSAFTIKVMDRGSSPVLHMNYLQEFLMKISQEEGFEIYYGLLTDLKTVVFVRYSRESNIFWLSKPIEIDLETDRENQSDEMSYILMLMASMILRTLKNWSSELE